MGMDIYGLNPKVKGKQPEIDWENSTEEQRNQYRNEMDNWEDDNPGYYFRANLWSWRPIHFLIDSVITMKELDWDTTSFAHNSGGGFRTQEECNIIADGLEDYINQMLEEEKETLYVNMGMWVTFEGAFNVPDEIQDELNRSIRNPFMTRPLVASNGEIVMPAHSTNVDHLVQFVNFLRHCGGFEIW